MLFRSAIATQMQSTATATVGSGKRITAEQPGTVAQLVAAKPKPDVRIPEAQIELRVTMILIGEPRTASNPAAATQPEAAPVVALDTMEVTRDVLRHGAVGATRPWLLACSLRTSCLSGRGVVLWTLARCLLMRVGEGVG